MSTEMEVFPDWSSGRLFSMRNASNSVLSSSGMKDLIPMSRDKGLK